MYKKQPFNSYTKQTATPIYRCLIYHIFDQKTIRNHLNKHSSLQTPIRQILDENNLIFCKTKNRKKESNYYEIKILN